MREHSAAAMPPRSSRHHRTRDVRWEVPIVDAGHNIVGWSCTSPEVVGAAFRHLEAERLTGEPVTCAYVQIGDREAALRAGAPAGWSGPWRCIAIVAESAAAKRNGPGAPLLDVAI